MKFLNPVARRGLALAVASALLSSPVLAQDDAAVTEESAAFIETFDGGDPAVMLGGQLDFGLVKAPWVYFLADGKLVLENRAEPQSIHYNDISFTKFPDSGVLESTEGAVIAATVESLNESEGGVGIMIGNGEMGAYLAFLVDGQGQYHLVQKQGSSVRRLHSGTSPAILAGQPNRLTFKVRGENVQFLANSEDIIEFPYTTRPGDGTGGLGIVAYGTGQFLIDEIEISRGN